MKITKYYALDKNNNCIAENTDEALLQLAVIRYCVENKVNEKDIAIEKKDIVL